MKASLKAEMDELLAGQSISALGTLTRMSKKATEQSDGAICEYG